MRFYFGLAALALAACGDRPEGYDARITDVRAIGLDDSVALVDDGAHRVLSLTPRDGQALDRVSLPIGKGVARVDVSPDGKRLFVLSTGDLTRKKAKDERPSLTVIEGGAARRYPLESPHSGLAIDPLGRWVALFAAPLAAGAQATFVENPNEVILIDLGAPVDSAITARTLRSFGGLPQRLSFTPVLSLPQGPRRLLLVETDQDLCILDLDNVRSKPERPEVTVRLTNGASAVASSPAAVVVDDGDPARNDDARIGVRLDSGSNVVTLTLVPNVAGAKTEDPAQVPNDFRATVNLTDVGGAPSDIAFVRADVGGKPALRLAAVVPSIHSAVLVDPETSITQAVDLAAPFSKLSIVTSALGGGASDTALLYGASSGGGVAFWSLGNTVGQPYRSVEVLPLRTPVDTVIDVPPPRPELKVLRATSTNTFYVLNLATRTAAPLTTLRTAELRIARDGLRMWAFDRGRPSLAQVSLADLHPTALPLDRPIDSVFDVARPGGGRSLVAIDNRGGIGATVIDALAPDTALSRSYYSLLLEGL